MEKIIVATKAAPAALGPYSQAVIMNGFVFASGQIPVNPETGDMPDGIDAQARQALDNLKAVLEASGSGLDKVVKTTCLLKDIRDFAAFNEVYKEYFPEKSPARSCFQVAAIPKDAGLEIEAIAAL